MSTPSLITAELMEIRLHHVNSLLALVLNDLDAHPELFKEHLTIETYLQWLDVEKKILKIKLALTRTKP